MEEWGVNYIDLKKCPICGSEPMGICCTSYPPQFGYSHCGIESGRCKSMHEAKEKWNEQVYLHTHKDEAEGLAKDIAERLDANISANCGECCHNEVCSQKERYKKVVEEIIRELYPDFDLVGCRLQCLHQMGLNETTLNYRG